MQHQGVYVEFLSVEESGKYKCDTTTEDNRVTCFVGNSLISVQLMSIKNIDKDRTLLEQTEHRTLVLELKKKISEDPLTKWIIKFGSIEARWG